MCQQGQIHNHTLPTLIPSHDSVTLSDDVPPRQTSQRLRTGNRLYNALTKEKGKKKREKMSVIRTPVSAERIQRTRCSCTDIRCITLPFVIYTKRGNPR